MTTLEDKIRDALAGQLGLSDEWKDGTYLYNLTRCKSAFSVGTMTMDDFEEVDEELLEETLDAVMDVILNHSF